MNRRRREDARKVVSPGDDELIRWAKRARQDALRAEAAEAAALEQERQEHARLVDEKIASIRARAVITCSEPARAHLEWLARIDARLLASLAGEDVDLLFDTRRAFHAMLLEEGPPEPAFKSALDKLHRAIFHEPITTYPLFMVDPDLKHGEEHAVDPEVSGHVYPGPRIEESKVVVNRIWPWLLLEECGHYCFYHEYRASNPSVGTSVEQRLVFGAMSSANAQHVVLATLVSIIMPEDYDDFLHVKRGNAELTRGLTTYPLPTLDEARDITRVITAWKIHPVDGCTPFVRECIEELNNLRILFNRSSRGPGA